MFKNLIKMGLIITSLLVFSCATEESTDSGKLNVVATTPMIGEYVKEVAGDNIKLTILMPPEANPHT